MSTEVPIITITGVPGTSKSTIALTMLATLVNQSKENITGLYISNEESVQTILDRGRRLGLTLHNLCISNVEPTHDLLYTIQHLFASVRYVVIDTSKA